MKSRIIVPALLVTCGLALSACGGTIFKTFDLTNDESFTTGARQRAIFNIPVGAGSVPGQVNPNRIVCAEPSPDVALAVANSFGLGVSIVSKGSGSVSSSQAEGIAQLAERVSTIQLLRDGLYRACEAYANGAISSTVYTMIVSRIDDVMVTLLSTEMAAGAFGRKLAALGTASSATVRASLDEAAKSKAAVEQANKDVDEAKKDVAKKQKAADKARDDAGDPVTPDDIKKIEKADKDLKDAKVRLEAKRALLKDRASTAADTSARANIVTAAGGITQKVNKDVAAVIAGMTEEYLNKPGSDTIIGACITELSGRLHSKETELSKICPQILHDIIEAAPPMAAKRYELKALRVNTETRKEEAQAIVALARLCGIKTPTDEQKAACTTLTNVIVKMTAKAN